MNAYLWAVLRLTQSDISLQTQGQRTNEDYDFLIECLQCNMNVKKGVKTVCVACVMQLDGRAEI